MSSLLPSLTGTFETLDGQRPGMSLYDHVMETRFVREPRNRTSNGGLFERVTYESRCGKFLYTTEIIPNKWSTIQEILVLKVPEPVLRDRQYANPATCESIYTFVVAGHGKIRMRLDIRQGPYLQPLVREFSLDICREHEWNYCWTKEDPTTFLNRGNFDEIWKAMMLLKVSIDRTDEHLKMRGRWLSRRNVGVTLFRREIENAGGPKPYVP